MRCVFFLLALLYFSSVCFSQERMKVYGVEGESLSLNLTPKQALNEAIQEAKINALMEAEISEQVGSVRVLFKIDNGENVTQSFSEVITSRLGADIVVDSIYPEQKSFDEFNHMKVTVRIDATVIKYDKKSDPTFFFEIRDLKDTYYNNEVISFTVIPSQNGYLKIFVINEKESILLYPYKNLIADYLSDTENYLFKAGQPVDFPVHNAYKPGYSIELEEGKEIENSLLIFIFTKDNFTWVEGISQKAINNRIANISPNKRTVEYFPIVLKKAIKN